MTRILIGLFLILTTAQVFAFDYSCVSIDENEEDEVNTVDRIDLKVNKNTAVLKFQDFDQDENYAISDYTPAHSTSKRPMMKMSLIGKWNNSYGGIPLTNFLGDKELTTGGYALRDGKIGGFIKVTGWVYIWTSYICFRK